MAAVVLKNTFLDEASSRDIDGTARARCSSEPAAFTRRGPSDEEGYVQSLVQRVSHLADRRGATPHFPMLAVPSDSDSLRSLLKAPSPEAKESSSLAPQIQGSEVMVLVDMCLEGSEEKMLSPTGVPSSVPAPPLPVAPRPCSSWADQEDAVPECSDGSRGHPFCCARPCRFFATRGSCWQGADCSCGHFPHSPEAKDVHKKEVEELEQCLRSGHREQMASLDAKMTEAPDDMQRKFDDAEIAAATETYDAKSSTRASLDSVVDSQAGPRWSDDCDVMSEASEGRCSYQWSIADATDDGYDDHGLPSSMGSAGISCFPPPGAIPMLSMPIQFLPSQGSDKHAMGTCKPCAFALKGNCRNGSACNHCHLHDPPQCKLKTRRSSRKRDWHCQNCGLKVFKHKGACPKCHTCPTN